MTFETPFSTVSCRGLFFPPWEEVRSGQSMQPNVMTNEQTPFCLRLKGPAEVYVGAEVTQ